MVHFTYSRSRLVEPESEIQEEYGGSQAPSSVGANIVWARQAPMHSTTIFYFYFESLFYAKFDCVLCL
jgi:hypothetical protein